jgi:kynurenine formamidase
MTELRHTGRTTMPAIDLTYPIAAGMPVYPGTPSPIIHPIANFDRDRFRELQLTFCSHTGTHMDAPSHLLKRGETLDQFPADHFRGTGLCIEVPKTQGGPIKWEFLKRYRKELSESDFVLFHTGWGRHWNSPRYFEGFPVFSAEAAKRLSDYSLKGMGVDTLSVDTVNTADYPVHHILLENRILIIENLANLDRLPGGRFSELICLPLHITESDGAPTRVIAFL